MATNMTNDEWANKKGFQDGYVKFTVQTLDAASITSGWYFFYNNGTVDYYVWMDKNGDGTTDDPGSSPNLDGKTGLAVDISAATTAIQVATALKTAINTTASSAIQLDDVVTITNPSNDNDTELVDYNTTFTIDIPDSCYRTKNDYPPASTLTSFREDANGLMITEARGDLDLDTKYLRNEEYRIVELMIDEEQGRETEDGRPIYIPRDYMFQRDRDKMASSGTTGFTRGTGH